MGPFSDEIQFQRAGAIKRLLDSNPQLDDHMRSIWLRKLNGLALNEDEYNRRVKAIYSNDFKPIGYYDYLG